MLYFFNLQKIMEKINMKSAQVQVVGEHGSVYLYTHDNASTLVSVVHEVLSRKQRWDDADYLTRIIFCAMIPYDKWSDDKGFGIGTQYLIDTNLLIVINVVTKHISISSYGSGVDNVTMEMEDFVQNFYRRAEF